MSETQTQAVAAPVSEAHAALQNLEVNADKLVNAKEAKFRFKKDKMGNQRPNVELKNMPVPSIDGLIAICQKGGKPLELLFDSMYDTVRSVVADWINSDEKNGADNFDPSKFTWEAIANMPKEDRRSAQIPEEQWTAFAEDYLKVMPGVTGKSEEAVSNAIQVYVKKFSQVKTNKPVLTKLKEQLALYMQNSKEAENFTDVLELLLRRVDNYLAADDISAIVENL